jgi:GAF domain-containing protein
MHPHPHALAGVFVELSGGIEEGNVDAGGLLTTLAVRCSELLAAEGDPAGCAATALLVADEDNADGKPVVAGSDPEVRLLEEEAAAWGEGPGHDSRRAGTALRDAPLDGPIARLRWPHYAPRGRALGYRRAAALPLRARGRTVGTLVVLRSDGEGPFRPDALRLGQAMADVAGIALAREREVRRGLVRAEQLQSALNSRIVIEQAKGVLAARHALVMEDAFERLRRHARSNRRRLAEVAADVVAGRLEV